MKRKKKGEKKEPQQDDKKDPEKKQHVVVKVVDSVKIGPRARYTLTTAEVDFVQLGLYPAVRPLTKSDLIFAFVVASIHVLIPGVFRYEHNNPFFGYGETEHFIAIIHIIILFPAILVSSLVLKEVLNMYSAEARALHRLGAITNIAEAKKSQLPSCLELNNVVNIDAWILLRTDILREYAAHPLKQTLANALAPIIILDFALLVALFVRVFVLQIQFDIFNVLAFFDMLYLNLHLIPILLCVAKCNSLTQRYHLKTLEKERYKLSKEMTSYDGDTKHSQELRKVVLLLESVVSKLRNIDEPVKLLGFEVDDASINRFLSVVAAGAASGVAKFAGVT